MKQGDILYSSWGYDQTNIDFYEVKQATGAMVTLQKLAAETETTGFMSGKTKPVLGKPAVEYPGQEPVPVKPIKRKVHKGGHAGEFVKIESYAYAWPWNGEPKGCSWYA